MKPSKNTALGVTVMPEWFQCEGIDAVLDRLQAIGVSAIATSPYLLEICEPDMGAREPPADGEAGRVRPLDRPLWGKYETWVRTAPSYVHSLDRYEGCRYQPVNGLPLTLAYPDLLDKVIAAAKTRGIAVHLQMMAASPPGYRVQFSGAAAEDQCLGPEGQPFHQRVDRNASLASPHVVDYGARLIRELLERYPDAAGVRLDWPEYPPYHLNSALFDFSVHGQQLMAAHNIDPEDFAQSVLRLRQQWQTAALKAVKSNDPHQVLTALNEAGWADFFSADGAGTPLWASKRSAALNMLQRYRAAVDAAAGPRHQLQPQIFPPPFHRISGFPLDGGLQGIADAIGVKLYTMHWPMIARYWAQDLIGESLTPGIEDVVANAIALSFGLVDETPAALSSLRYPEPQQAHPVGAQAQRSKLLQAQQLAGDIPVIAFTHSYGPMDDVHARISLAAELADAGQIKGGIWVNRYGYLSDQKLAQLKMLQTQRSSLRA